MLAKPLLYPIIASTNFLAADCLLNILCFACYCVQYCVFSLRFSYRAVLFMLTLEVV